MPTTNDPVCGYLLLLVERVRLYGEGILKRKARPHRPGFVHSWDDRGRLGKITTL